MAMTWTMVNKNGYLKRYFETRQIIFMGYVLLEIVEARFLRL